MDEQDPFEMPVRLPARRKASGKPSREPSRSGGETMGEARVVARYRLRLTPEEVLERLIDEPKVLAMRSSALPEFQPPVKSREFTATINEEGFILHRAASERGHSGTGLLPNLYLHARLAASPRGSELSLSFAHGRASWVWQRGAGLVLVTLLSLLWVATGGAGTMLARMGAVAIFLLFVSPLVVNDLTRRKRMLADRTHLLSLTERLFGRDALAEASDAPYREA